MPPTLAPPVDPQSLPARLPEPYRSSMARPRLLLGGLPPHHTRRAVGRSLRLMLQAHRAIEATAALLGDAAWLDPSGERAWRRLHVRDPDDHRAIFLRPMLTLKVGGSVVFGQAISMRPEGAAPLVPIDAPEGWQPGEPHWDLPEEPVDLVPSGPDMHGGEFRITDGPAFYELRYRKDGVHFENTEHGGDHMAAFLFGATRPWQLDPAAEPPQVPPIRLLLRDDLDVHGWPTERLAQALAELADGNHTPARVLLPVDHPGGVVGCWQRVRRPLARWLWQQDPDWQGWVAVDGLVGTAVGQGRSRDEAEASCRAAIAATRPRRIEPEPYDPARIAAEMAARDAASERAVAQQDAGRDVHC